MIKTYTLIILDECTGEQTVKGFFEFENLIDYDDKLQAYADDLTTWNESNDLVFEAENYDFTVQKVIMEDDINSLTDDCLYDKWHIEDIKTQALENDNIVLTDLQANKVLYLLYKEHDAEIGINWEVIDCTIDYVLKMEATGV